MRSLPVLDCKPVMKKELMKKDIPNNAAVVHVCICLVYCLRVNENRSSPGYAGGGPGGSELEGVRHIY